LLSQCKADSYEVFVQAQDRLILCSSGLWQQVRDAQIESILRTVADPRLAAERLAATAHKSSGNDNASLVIADALLDSAHCSAVALTGRTSYRDVSNGRDMVTSAPL
jgi:protein phosphatase